MCVLLVPNQMKYGFSFPWARKEQYPAQSVQECVTTDRQETGFTKLVFLRVQRGFQKQYCHGCALSH